MYKYLPCNPSIMSEDVGLSAEARIKIEQLVFKVPFCVLYFSFCLFVPYCRAFGGGILILLSKEEEGSRNTETGVPAVCNNQTHWQL